MLRGFRQWAAQQVIGDDREIAAMPFARLKAGLVVCAASQFRRWASSLRDTVMSISRTVVITILTTVLLSHQIVFAFPKCDFSTLSERFKRSRAVFSGEALEVKQTEEFFEARFKVSKSWKDVRAPEIVVFTYPVGSETPNFVVGRKYLVFAHVFRNKLLAGGCSGTVELENAQDEVRQLERWSRRTKRKK